MRLESRIPLKLILPLLIEFEAAQISLLNTLWDYFFVYLQAVGANSADFLPPSQPKIEIPLQKDTAFYSETSKRHLGFYYFNARWYDPTLGRFISEDPKRSWTDWYVYCRNNPLNFIDKDGQEENRLPNIFDLLQIVSDLQNCIQNKSLFPIPTDPTDTSDPRNVQKQILNRMSESYNTISEPLSFIASVIPYVGDTKDAIETISGYDILSGEELSIFDRGLTIMAASLPIVGGKAARTIFKGVFQKFAPSLIFGKTVKTFKALKDSGLIKWGKETLTELHHVIPIAWSRDFFKNIIKNSDDVPGAILDFAKHRGAGESLTKGLETLRKQLLKEMQEKGFKVGSKEATELAQNSLTNFYKTFDNGAYKELANETTDFFKKAMAETSKVK
jgi:RHS repeat-associated protein